MDAGLTSRMLYEHAQNEALPANLRWVPFSWGDSERISEVFTDVIDVKGLNGAQVLQLIKSKFGLPRDDPMTGEDLNEIDPKMPAASADLSPMEKFWGAR